MTSTAAILSFEGEHAFLSNFFADPLTFRGMEFPTAEHAFQSCKAASEEGAELIRDASTPGRAKRMGRKIEVRSDWEEVKVESMRSVLKAKFSNAFLAQQLRITGTAELVEGNNWGDTFWGVCNGVGENVLGQLLMEIRSSIDVNGGVQ